MITHGHADAAYVFTKAEMFLKPKHVRIFPSHVFVDALKEIKLRYYQHLRN